MPCYTITQVKLILNNADIGLLKKALEGMGKTVYQDGLKRLSWQGGSYNKDGGLLTVRDKDKGNAIQRAYSKEVIMTKAQRFGWTVKETGQNKYEVLKR
jgi:hypothetical protein